MGQQVRIGAGTLLCAFTVGGAQVAHADDVHWGYSGAAGPDAWGSLAPEFGACSTGGAQSPIDLRDPTVTALPDIEPNYQPAPLVITNIGHTIRVDYAAGSALVLGDDRYALLQFHFHAPSEHTVGGAAFPMEMHFVHRSDAGQLAVLGVLLEEGAQNDGLGPIWTHLPRAPGTVAVKDVIFNAAVLLPSDRRYDTYAGSLTTPPCTEGVRWIVLREPSNISRDQIAAFRVVMAPNARPVQPRNGREILTTE